MTEDEREEIVLRLRGWVEAYPLDIFPEPDLQKAARVLQLHGMTLDAISASIMRRTLKAIIHMLDGTKAK